MSLPHRIIIGTRIHVTSFTDATTRIIEWARAGESRYVCAANTHVVMEAHDSPDYRQIINNADLATPDGMPVVWALRRLGATGAERVDGPTLTLHVCEAAARYGVTVGLYGSTPETLAAFAKCFPGIRVVCAISPPFRQLTTEEDEAFTKQIVDSGARALLVSLGCPKQERWMADHRGRIPAVMLGIGAALDFHTGRVKRAPAWAQRVGLEWLFRLCAEPRRLAGRYFRHNPRFMWLLAAQLWRSSGKASAD